MSAPAAAGEANTAGALYSCSLPPPGGGLGRGGKHRWTKRPASTRSPPHPCPSPAGGGEKEFTPSACDSLGGEARVGPNAVTQLGRALTRRLGEVEAQALFTAAGIKGLYAEPPEAMLPQSQAAALHQALWARLPALEAGALAYEAGWETGGYLLAHRIPKPAQWLLKVLPRPLALRLLLAAIARHAWTFAGSGRFSAQPGRETVLEIAANPLAAGRCAWHGAVFERLFRALVSPEARVEEIACCAEGAPACRFVLRL